MGIDDRRQHRKDSPEQLQVAPLGQPDNMRMWRLKSCPKCKGDVVVDHDYHGWYQQCLYCGYLHDLGSVAEMKRQTNGTEKTEKCTKGKIHTR